MNTADHTPLNGDLGHRVSVDTAAMEWSASPSGTVFRKRVHRVGPAESGQVTSVVRYAPNSTFPEHDHADGEEILVLEGVFSDQQGDWPAGTYLLNPEGFRHAPFSQPGCVIFVKLRQYPGCDRQHLALATDEQDWLHTEHSGIDVMPLYAQEGYSDETRLERWAPETEAGERWYPEGAELFVLDGMLEDEEGRYLPGHWLRLPARYAHRPHSEHGCRLYVKTGGFHYLESVAD